MDKTIADAARKLAADNIFETAMHCDENKNFLQKQISIAAKFLTDDQKEELRQRGFAV